MHADHPANGVFIPRRNTGTCEAPILVLKAESSLSRIRNFVRSAYPLSDRFADHHEMSVGTGKAAHLPTSAMDKEIVCRSGLVYGV